MTKPKLEELTYEQKEKRLEEILEPTQDALRDPGLCCLTASR